MSETNGERSTGQQASKSAISHDQYDAALLDLDGVITDTASVHATCWKQMFNEYLRKRATQKGLPFCPFDPAAVIGFMSMESPVSTAFAIFSYRAASGSPREARTIRQRPKQCGGLATARTSSSIKSLMV
jgi:beta-phosphoglucomutase-like phosphatase (HAD superfamily)